MATYNYSLSSDFANEINPTCMDRTIIEFGFSIPFIAIIVEYESDLVEIRFDGNLPSLEIDDLDTLVANHNPDTTCDPENNEQSTGGGTKVDFIFNDQSGLEYIYNKKEEWIIATSFIFEGSLNWNPKRLSVITSLKTSATGKLRLYDLTHDNEICFVEWNNIEKGIVSTETFNNIPNEPSLIEVQFKTLDKNNDARLHYLAIY